MSRPQRIPSHDEADTSSVSRRIARQSGSAANILPLRALDLERIDSLLVRTSFRDGTRVILTHEIAADWRRREGHVLRITDILHYLEPLPETLIIGTGKFGMMRPDHQFEGILTSRHISLVVERTGHAWRTFNTRHELGQKVVDALHVTC